MLEIRDLRAGIENKEIVSGLSLTVKTGEIAAIMGPNGSGKSTLANVLMGHPGYVVNGGSATLGGINLLGLEPEARAAAGLFLAFQYPPALPGVSVAQFLRLCRASLEKTRGNPPTSSTAFLKELRNGMKRVGIKPSFAERSLNDGFSGGERKRMEILQLLLLKPKLVILDEIDSGLDIDAIKSVAEAVQELDLHQTGILAITHYKRLLNYLRPDSIHVMKDGKIVRSGNVALADELEEHGYAPA
jgi:Fe-S cluster assembly ATP-binding protein